MAVGAKEIALIRTDAQVDPALLGFVQERPTKPRETVMVNLATEPLLDIPFALPSKIPGNEVAPPCPHAVGDVVAGDVEDLALIGDAADYDAAVEMAGVVVIDSNPIERGIEVLLHPAHQLAREGFEIGQLHTILGGDDEAELSSPQVRSAKALAVKQRADGPI